MTDEGRILCIDYGTTRIGLALSDPLRMFAHPFGVLVRRSAAEDISAIQKIVRENGVIKILVGLPTDPASEVGQQAARVIRWARRLATLVPIPLSLWDESHSTLEAARLTAGSRQRSRRQATSIDAVAAATILQDYLEAGGAFDEPGFPLETFADIS